MTHPSTTESGRRWWQTPVLWTLALSLGIHALIFLGGTALVIVLNAHPEWFPQWLRDSLQRKPPVAELSPAVEYQPQPDEYEIPLSFIEVDPNLAVPDAPKDARFQSTANTAAQNVAAPKPELNQPFIGGTQEKFPKLFDTDRRRPNETQPAVPVPPDVADADVTRPEQTARPQPPRLAETPTRPIVPPTTEPAKAPPQPSPQPPATTTPPEPKGEMKLALVRPAPETKSLPRPAQPPPPKEPAAPAESEAGPAAQDDQRPSRRRAQKSLAQVRQTKGILVGEQMKQDGGVDKRGVASMAVKRGPMGDYGSRMWAAVQERWYATLEAQRFAGEFVGKVVVTFKLHTDGTITELTATPEGADEGIYMMYCISAIQLSASFGPWSSEMLTTYGPKAIDCQCVFWY